MVGVLLVAALNSVAGARRAQQIGGQRQQGHLLAEALLAEIAALPYEDAADSPGPPGPSPGEVGASRALFNDMNDYTGWTASPPQRKDGTPIPSTTDWSESVTIAYLNAATYAPTGTNTDTGVACVKVSLSYQNAPQAELTLIRTRGLSALAACCLAGNVCKTIPIAECAARGGMAGSAGTNCWTYTCNTDLVAYWKFDEGSGTTVSDSVGTHTGTTVSGPTWVNGHSGKALNFDGSSDYVRIPHQADLNITGELTITAWIYKKSNNGWDEILSKGETGNNHAYAFHMSDSTPVFTIYTGVFNDIFATFNINKTTWYFLAVTYNDATNQVKFYRNAQLLSTVTCNVSIVSNNEAILLGRCTSPNYFDGYMDEVRLYKRALTDTEILDIYNGTASP